jgi:uncharacterized protein
MMPLSVSRAAARRALLDHHYLLQPRSLESSTGITAVMDRLRCIQVDPINTVGTNVNLVLQARVRDYRPTLLDDLLYRKHALIEGFDKLRSIVRATDWPYLTGYRKQMREHHAATDHPPREVLDAVLAEIMARGPLSSLELPDHGKADWRWAPARVTRAALDMLFDWGEIGVADRIGSRKIYATIDDVLPAEMTTTRGPGGYTKDRHADQASYIKWHAEHRVHSLGIAARRAGDSWLGMGKVTAAERNRALDELADEGRVVAITVDDEKTVYFVPPALAEMTNRSVLAGPEPAEITFIAPLDNVMWDRRLIRDLFAFDYTWEVYKPAAQRHYGYYVLPVLYGDQFTARWEPRREDRHLVVRGLWWEPPITRRRDDPELASAFGQAIREFMAYLGLEKLRCEKNVKKADREFLMRVFRG